ncbi:ATP-binding protein [Trinickia caryophylli]|uniref:Uncharacterized protein n=1 Tax=Trinickia caryophylli TaxID=28094 RepID=A0A1X7HBC6_TRICW|nr:ATP-binding protein [Trinickia caryophylli]WQE14874.1 ATP-binding protein [Trinickia caryophylli]GLU35768.1 hypothetical protein Busp01_56100 [Trinickia caryophylli]SMF82272.1 hypothetical protein SAMN06295900_12530 [Trinickia caryophylli]
MTNPQCNTIKTITLEIRINSNFCHLHHDIHQEWDQAFPANRLLASATLDRLRHNAYCLVLDGHSYRSPRHLPEHHLNLANAG